MGSSSAGKGEACSAVWCREQLRGPGLNNLKPAFDGSTRGILLDSGKVIASGELEIHSDRALMAGYNLEMPLPLTLELREVGR